MSNTKLIVTAQAFLRKAELGGGYRAKVMNRLVEPKVVIDCGVHDDLEAARYAARVKAVEVLGSAPYVAANVYPKAKKGLATEWYCHYYNQ